MNQKKPTKNAIPTDVLSRYQILYQLSHQSNPTKITLSKKTNIPPSTIAKIIDRLRKEFQMQIVFTRDQSTSPKPMRGNVGHYAIHDWGILNKEAFLATYSYYDTPKASPNS